MLFWLNFGPFSPYKSTDWCKNENVSNIFDPFLRYRSFICSPLSPLAMNEARIDPVDVPAIKSTLELHPGTSLSNLSKI